MKVLLAEDDKFIREGLAEILRDEGYRVVSACDGESALRLFESQSPDFVCLDIRIGRLVNRNRRGRVRTVNGDDTLRPPVAFNQFPELVRDIDNLDPGV